MKIKACWETVSDMSESNVASMFLCELRTRALVWLLFGMVPTVSFESDELRAIIMAKRPHELRTAKRLSSNGVRTRFVQDVERIIDSATCEVKQVGMADLANGYEVKTLKTAATFSSIDGYLRRAAKKRNVVAVVFDNADNQGMDDEVLGLYIIRARRRFIGRVYVLCRDGSYIRKI